MSGKLTRITCELWTVRDNLPNESEAAKVTAVVALTYSPTKSGDLGGVARSVTEVAARRARSHGTSLILSNRFRVDGSGESVAEVGKKLAVKLGMVPWHVVIPTKPRHPRIRNTWFEIQFAVRLLKLSPEKGPKILFVVADMLHMRRTLAIARKAIGKSDISLRWESVDTLAHYGRGYIQKRFTHPLLFLHYEPLATVWSKGKGWI